MVGTASHRSDPTASGPTTSATWSRENPQELGDFSSASKLWCEDFKQGRFSEGAGRGREKEVVLTRPLVQPIIKVKICKIQT